MKQMDGMIAKMTDAAKQKEAIAALDQSKAAMKAGNKTNCMKYGPSPQSHGALATISAQLMLSMLQGLELYRKLAPD